MNQVSSPSNFLKNLSTNPKIQACSRSLEQVVKLYDDIIFEFESLHLNYEKSKSQCLALEEVKRTNCAGCDELKKTLEAKNKIIQLVASAITRLDETKNLKILEEVFKILCSDTKTLTLPKDSLQEDIKKDLLRPEDEISDASMEEESVSEIEGTPGRTSPIIFSKKSKSKSLLQNCGKEKEKIKCSPSWAKSSCKMLKLSPAAGRGGQRRLQVAASKRVVDLTTSPGFRRDDDESPVVKKEPYDHDETILPSPTSAHGNADFSRNKIKLSTSKQSPMKFKKPSEVLRLKRERIAVKTEMEDADVTNIKHSINLLNQNRFKNSPCKAIKHTVGTPIKCYNETKLESENKSPTEPKSEVMGSSINLLRPCNTLKIAPNDSETFTAPPTDNSMNETNVSLSLLNHVEKMEIEAQIKHNNVDSPSKRPLAENINITNVPAQVESQILQAKVKKATDNSKPPLPDESLYKEPTVRKKAEKRSLPGWSCDQCKNFYSELYADNPDMLAKLMQECSKHRARRDPTRPKTPENFWRLRWSVPEDTEAFNRQNNAS